MAINSLRIFASGALLLLFLVALVAALPNPDGPRLRSTEGLVVTGSDGGEEGAADEPRLESPTLQPVKYDGAQLWRIGYDDQPKKNAVAELQDRFEASMWNYNATSIDIFVTKPMLRQAECFLRTAKIPFEVVIADIQRAIDTENPSLEETELWENRDGHRMTWTAYHRLEDIYDWMEYLAKTYPDLCSTKSIGKSVQGRELKVLRISNGNPANKAIWMDGGIHAREWISPATVTYIANNLVEDWDNHPEYLRSIDWYILPVHNPDGYEHSHQYDRLWRKNRGGLQYGPCAGVDLNRNYGYKWGGQGTSKQPCSEIYCGSGPFSEPETKAVSQFMETSAANWKGFLTFHSYGQYILYPWGYDRVVPSDHVDLRRVGDAAANRMLQGSGSRYTVGPSGNTLYPAAGGSDDWARGALNIKYAYTVELRDTGRYGFVLPANQIQPTGDEAVQFVDTIAQEVSKL